MYRMSFKSDLPCPPPPPPPHSNLRPTSYYLLLLFLLLKLADFLGIFLCGLNVYVTKKKKGEKKKKKRKKKQKKKKQHTNNLIQSQTIVMHCFIQSCFIPHRVLYQFFLRIVFMTNKKMQHPAYMSPPHPPPPFPGLSCSNWYKSRAQTKDNSWLLATSIVITELPPLCHVRFVSQLASPVTSTQVVHRWLKVVLTDFRLDTSDGLPSHNLRRWRRTNES